MKKALLLKDKEKIAFFQDNILKWFENYGRSFPWRKGDMSNYEYIIAETLLQRTKAETVAPFYIHFISTFPNWVSLNKASREEIEIFLKPIGLYRQRSARLKKLAQEMIHLNEKIPSEKEELEKISFFGQYIVNAVLMFIHGKPAPLLDVNMSRVLERFFRKRKLADIRYDPYLQILAHEIVLHNNPKNINWAILDFAALVCKPKPLCTICPLKDKCTAYKQIFSKALA